MLSHWNITPHSQSNDIPPGHIIPAAGQPVFALNYPLYVERLTRELQLQIWNLWLDSAGNRTWASQTRREPSNYSSTRLVQLNVIIYGVYLPTKDVNTTPQRKMSRTFKLVAGITNISSIQYTDNSIFLLNDSTCTWDLHIL